MRCGNLRHSKSHIHELNATHHTAINFQKLKLGDSNVMLMSEQNHTANAHAHVKVRWEAYLGQE